MVSVFLSLRKSNFWGGSDSVWSRFCAMQISTLVQAIYGEGLSVILLFSEDPDSIAQPTVSL